MIISSVTVSDTSFKITPDSAKIPSGDSAKFYITFSASGTGTRTGKVVFANNSAIGSDTITVSGVSAAVAVKSPLTSEGQWRMSVNAPNSVSRTRFIEFTIPSSGYSKLEIFSFRGQKVKTLVDAIEQPGRYIITWDAGQAAAGVYFCRLQVAERVLIQKISFK